MTCFIMLHGAIVVVKILDTHHCRLPLVQGGLEIQNKDALFKYESLVEQDYKEPVDGKFEDVTDTVLKDLGSDADEETDDEAEDTEQAVDTHDEAGAEDM